jgi:hypothetical protein
MLFNKFRIYSYCTLYTVITDNRKSLNLGVESLQPNTVYDKLCCGSNLVGSELFFISPGPSPSPT